MIEMVVESIRRDMQTKQRFAALHVASKETEEVTIQYFVYVPVDEADAYVIATELQTPSVRPHPQDVNQVIDSKAAQLTSVVILYKSNNLFSAQIIFDAEGKQIKVDTSPGNAVASALHAKVPILIEEGTLEILNVK